MSKKTINRLFTRVLLTLSFLFLSAFDNSERIITIKDRTEKLKDWQKIVKEYLANDDFQSALPILKTINIFSDIQNKVNLAYCEYKTGNDVQALVYFNSLADEPDLNDKQSQFVKKMIAYLDDKKLNEVLSKTVGKSNNYCKKRHCKWRWYFTDGKVEVLNHPPKENRSDVWRVESIWRATKGSRVGNVEIFVIGAPPETTEVSDRWIYFVNQWVMAEEIPLYPYQKPIIEKGLAEHQYVSKILYWMNNNADLSCYQLLKPELIRQTTSLGHQKIEYKLKKANKMIDLLTKKVEEGGYYGQEKPSSIDRLFQARLALIQLNEVYANQQLVLKGCYAENAKYINKERLISEQQKYVAGAISAISNYLKKSN